MIPPGGEPLHPLDSRPDPVDRSVFRGAAWGCAIEGGVLLVGLLIVGGLGLAFGWWSL